MAGSFSCFLGWTTEITEKPVTGTRKNAGRCGQETDTEHVCGQGRQREGVGEI